MQGVNVYDAIRDMGSIDKIVMVHFRNVRGSFPKFQETFVDNGDVDMYRAMQAYRDVGFKGPFSLDHSPDVPRSGDCKSGIRHRLSARTDPGRLSLKHRVL